MNNIGGLIFSKDRAMQLQATIESLLLHCKEGNTVDLVVLYKVSNELHADQYNELKKEFSGVNLVEEQNFREQVLSVLDTCQYILFLVDDNIFVKPFSIRIVMTVLQEERNALGFSLRLGTNTNYCYPLSSQQTLPQFSEVGKGMLKYYWPTADCDFGYPLEVSSSVFRSHDISRLLSRLEFDNPNKLETVMNQNKNLCYSMPYLLTFEESVTFCNPVNVVQNVYQNKHGTADNYTPEGLAHCFARGLAVDVEKYIGFTPNAAHQEVELHFKRPDGTTAAAEAEVGAGQIKYSEPDPDWKPKFSIIMANYNNGKYIADAIESVLKQTFKDWELIIIEDCSTDNSLDVIKRYMTDKRIRLIRHDRNSGYTTALKTGIANVRSEYFGILDSDDRLARCAVQTMYAHHIGSSDCGLIYSQFVYCDENLTPKRLGYCRRIPVGKTNLEVNTVSHFKTFKLRDYLKTSGYDESILYAEDKDVIYKMEELTHLKFVDECLYLYREVPNSTDHDPQKAAIGKRSMERAKMAAQERRNQQRAIPKSQPSHPKLSVILTTYNRPRLLEKTLSGFADQTAPKEDFEVIVVDDGSEPPIKDVVEKFRNQTNIVYLYQKNSGLAAARNNGIRAAKGQIVLFSDDDDVPATELVSEHLRNHQENPDQRIAVLGHLQWHPDLEITPLMHYVTKVGGEYFGYDSLQDGQFYDVWKWWGGLVSAKLSLLQSVEGPFDNRLRFGYEDTELACRLLHKGVKVLYNARAKSFILRPVDFESFCRRRYMQGRALYRVAVKHPEIIIPRYQLQNAANLYYSRYAPFLEEWTAKVTKFEALLKSRPRLDYPDTDRHLRSLYSVYRECFLGYWLKGYVEEMEAVEKGEVSLHEPVNLDARSSILDTRLSTGCEHRASGVECDYNRSTMPRALEALRMTFVNSDTPGFDIGSSNLRIYHILKILADAGHKIDHLYFSQYKSDKRYKAVFDGAVNFIKTRGSIQSFCDYLHFNHVQKLDYVWVTNLWSVDYLDFALQLTQWLKRHRPQTKVVIDTMDFHHKKLMRKFKISNDNQDLLKAEQFLQLEKQLYPLADIVLTVTEVEKRDILESIGSDCRVSVIPNIHRIPPYEPTLQGRKNICFLGSFHVRHNLDAAKWFVNQVFPLIVEKTPQVQFHILGFDNGKYKDEFEASRNVKVLGYVEDAESAVSNYRLFVCPMTYGAGMKGKLGVAAAASTPFVTTTIGAEGFDFVDGQDCFIADEPGDFAQKCLRVLSQDDLWSQFSIKAKSVIAEKFSIRAVSEKIHAFLQLNAALAGQAKAPAVSATGPAWPEDAMDAMDAQAATRPKVTIITSCHNSERFLPECLDSVRNQTLCEWELFLLDDGSTDDSRKVIDRYCQKDARIKAFHFDKSQGPYVRRNFAIERANSDFIVIHDADDIMSPAKLQMLYEEMAADDRLAVAGSFFRRFIEEFKGLQYTDCHELPTGHSGILTKSPSWGHAISLGSSIIRKSVFDAIGLFDENPFASDTFWFAKLAEYARHYPNVRVRNIPEYLTLIRVHSNCQTGVLPCFDPRNRRTRYRQYCERKLKRVRQKLQILPDTDIRTELRNCKCSDFLQSFKNHIIRWESEPLDKNVIPQLLKEALWLFNNTCYVTCVSVLSGIEVMDRDITRKFRHYDLLRAMALFALDLKQQSLMYLNREMQNHNSPAAKQFIIDYFEKRFGGDIQNWCAKRQGLCDLYIADAELVHPKRSMAWTQATENRGNCGLGAGVFQR